MNNKVQFPGITIQHLDLADELASTAIHDLGLVEKSVEEIDTTREDYLVSVTDLETLETLEEVTATLESLPDGTTLTTDTERVMLNHVLESIERRLYVPVDTLAPALESVEKKDNLLKRMYEAIKKALIKFYNSVKDFFKRIGSGIASLLGMNKKNKESIETLKKAGITEIETTKEEQAIMDETANMGKLAMEMLADSDNKTEEQLDAIKQGFDKKSADIKRTMDKLDEDIKKGDKQLAKVADYITRVKEVDAIFDALLDLQKKHDADEAKAKRDLEASKEDEASLKKADKKHRKQTRNKAAAAAALADSAKRITKQTNKSLAKAIAQASDDK